MEKNTTQEIEKIKLLIPPLEVGPNDGFKSDALGRKIYGEALQNLVINSHDELVIALDGDWGEGKTTFVKMWQGLLAANKIHSIYIDAFKNDYIDDPFVLISKSIINYAKEKKVKLINFKAKTKKVAVSLLPLLTKAVINLVPSAGVGESVTKLLEKKLNDILEESDVIPSFREELSKLPERLNKNGDNPLVIIIDELDRCKPTFAVETLEKVKHLFSVKNIMFLLVMNKDQLKKSIKNIYGHDIDDAHTYLQKFINIDVRIGKNLYGRISTINTYCEKIFRDYHIKLSEIFNNTGAVPHLLGYLKEIGIHCDLSLRQIERVFTNLLIFENKKELDIRLSMYILVSVIKVVNPELFKMILDESVSPKEIINELKLVKKGKQDASIPYHLDLMISDIEYYFPTVEEIEELKKKQQSGQLNDRAEYQRLQNRSIMAELAKQLDFLA